MVSLAILTVQKTFVSFCPPNVSKSLSLSTDLWRSVQSKLDHLLIWNRRATSREAMQVYTNLWALQQPNGLGGWFPCVFSCFHLFRRGKDKLVKGRTRMNCIESAGKKWTWFLLGSWTCLVPATFRNYISRARHAPRVCLGHGNHFAWLLL